MRDVKVVVTNVVQDGFPAGTVFGKLRLSMVDKNDASKAFSADVDDSAGPSEFTFPLVPVGGYIVAAQRLDSIGSNLGAMLSQDFDVIDVPTVSGSIPSTMTVTLQ